MAKDLIPLLRLPEEGPAMIALVGAGGKTTTMIALAREYKALNRKVLVTTTTRIFVPAEDCRDALELGLENSGWNPAVPDGTITVVGEAIEETGKLVGVSPEFMDRVYQDGHFDIILIEADGAKGKPIKAPAAYEPVIPDRCTHVIGLIGMDALGQALNDRWVHRLNDFLEVTGGAADQCIDEDILLKLIGSPNGLFKNSPPQAARILLLNKCSDSALAEAADSLVTECLLNGIGALASGAWR